MHKVMGAAALGLSLLFSGAAKGIAQVATTIVYPYQDYHLPTEKRVDDLVSRMTLPEKVAQMMNNSPAIPRLGIDAYEWWGEGLHGLWTIPATVFPEPIGRASSFDLPLESRISTAISDEARAWYYRSGGKATTERLGNPIEYHGLTLFSPNINIFRDPRWGRGQETFGEDPYLTAQYGVTFIRGIQGSDPKYLKAIATAKHFAVHSGPENERHKFDANPSLYDLNDTYLPAFEATVRDAKAASVMGAYSSLYGVPDNASPLLIQDILRKKWGFQGYVISDYGAVLDIFFNHHYAKTLPEAVADAVNNGCDMSFFTEYDTLPTAVQQGLVSEKQIDISVKRIFTARMKLGMFDPPSMVPYSKIPITDIDSPAHRQIALQSARESIVLLKNAGYKNLGPLLPLSRSIKSLAVIGPNADNLVTQSGNYSGTSSKEVSLLDGINKYAAASGIKVEYVKGSDWLTPISETLSAIPASALSSGGQPGLKGEYYSNETLDGAPVATHQDTTVDFNWSQTPPKGLGHDHYSVRWTGTLTAPQDGQYTLAARGDDGFRLFVNDQKIVDDWSDHGTETKSATITLKAGQAVPIRLEYYQSAQDAVVSLLWQTPSSAGPFGDSIAAANRADEVIFVGGISSQVEGEEGTPLGGDRTSLDLPTVQDQLLKALVATGKPVIFVLMSGSAMSINWAQDNVPAIMEAWYSGEEGGTAIAEALFGDYNPAGRLPVTFYKSLDQVPDFHDYSMKSRTYRYFDGQPLYGFGYGLSYTKFAYSGLSAPKSVRPGQSVTVEATVHNIGSRSGDEVVELYLRPAPKSAVREITPGQPMPRLILAGFQRVPLAAHSSKVVRFTLTPKQLLLVNAKGERTLQPGDWQIYVGGSQPDLSGAKTPSGSNVSALLTVR